MGYKSRLPDSIRKFVEYQLSHYHETQKQLSQYKADMIPSPTPSYSLEGGGGHGGESRPVEQLAVRMATDAYAVELAKWISAIEYVMNRVPPDTRELISLVYWSGTYTVEGAGQKVLLSRTVAYKRINDVLTAIAIERGLVPY